VLGGESSRPEQAVRRQAGAWLVFKGICRDGGGGYDFKPACLPRCGCLAGQWQRRVLCRAAPPLPRSGLGIGLRSLPLWKPREIFAKPMRVEAGCAPLLLPPRRSGGFKAALCPRS
jgi:hypothetical protein